QHIQDIDWYNGDILAVAHRGVETELVVYDTKGNEKTILPTPDDIAVRAADIGGTGSSKVIRFIADSPKHPREVFAVTANGTEKLSHHNVWLDGVKLAEQTTFSYEARDGRNIEGLLITPHGDVPKGGWPLILTVHGGPEAHFSDGWITRYSNPGQFGATQGYAVYYPNYRGSTGRGVAFAKEHQNDYAGKEFNDLVDGVDALVKAGIVNRDRVGITGGSYGGYASMWGATAQSEHFAASVAFVGISNQVSKFGTSDIPNEMHLVHSLKWPWEDNWMNLIKRSPLYHVGKSTTPTLILHGEKDTRVHPSQSMELFRSMKVRTQTPVRLVFYPNEGHGNRKAASQYDYALRLMRWMNTYLAADASRTDAMPEFDLDIESLLNGDDEEKSDD
ncbi:MAG: S9 family peptidase, partial [Glaciecola sp.]